MARKSKKYGRRRGRRRYGKRRYKTFSKIPLSKIPRALLPEIKKLDIPDWNNETLDTITAGVSALHLTKVQQGDNVFNRQGDKIFVKWVTFKGILVGSTSAHFSAVRLMVVQDKGYVDTGGTFPSILEIINGTGISDMQQVFCHRNYGTSKRYNVLFDKQYTLEAINSDGGPGETDGYGGGGTRVIKFKIPINKVTEFYTVNSPSTANGIYVYAFSNLSSNTPQITGVFRTYFTDV